MKLNKAVVKFVKLGMTMIIALMILYVTIAISLTGFDFGYRVFTEPAMEMEPGRDIVVTIDKGMGAGEIGAELERKGLVRDGNLFMIQLMLSAYKDDIQPGSHILNTSMTPKEMMILMSEEKETEEESETGTDSQKDTEKESASQKDDK